MERPLRRASWPNLLLATVVGVAVGVSPHTSGHRLAPSIAGGVATAALFFAWRERRRRRQPEAADPVLARPPAGVVLCLLLFTALFAATALFLYRDWTESIWQNGHGIFLPLALAALTLRALRREPGGEPDASAWGFAFVGAGLALAVFDAGIQTQLLSSLGLVLCLPGLSLLFLGARRTRALAVPLLLAFFMLPIPTSIASDLYMPQATAAATAPLVALVGIPVARFDTVLVLPREVFAISDRCSGASAFFAGTTLAVFLALHCPSRWRALALLLAPWPLVVAFSAIRCAALVIFASEYGLAVIEMATHGLSGIFAFWTVIAGLLLLAGRPTLRRAFA